jgi:secretion system chaperone SscA
MSELKFIKKDYDLDVEQFLNHLSAQRPMYELMNYTQKEINKAQEIGKNLLRQNNFSEAKDVFYLLCFLDHFDFSNWLNLGKSEQLDHKYEEALTIYQTALHLKPEDPFAYIYSYQCSLKLDEKEAAEKWLRFAIEACEPIEQLTDLTKKLKGALNEKK